MGQQTSVAVPTSVSVRPWPDIVQKGRAFVVAGLGNRSSQTYAIAKSPGVTKRVVLWLAHDDREAAVTEEILRFWMEDQPVERVSAQVSPALLSRLLSQEPFVLVSSVNLLETPLPRPEEFRRSIIRLNPGTPASPVHLAQHLVNVGYLSDRTAATEGSFARRGGILDVFPVASRYAVRLEFAGDRIDRILRLGRTPQSKGRPIETVDLPPANLPPGTFGNLESYLAPIPNLLVISHDPEESFDEEERLAATLRRFRQHAQLIIQSFRTNLAEGEGAVFDFRAAPLFHNNFDELAKDLRNRQRKGWTISVFSDRFGELQERLKSKRLAISGREAYPEALEGFESERAHVLCLTDRELFGRREKQAAPPRERLDLGFLLELKPGDFIVHLDHGVGKFLGMSENMVDGVHREYFVLEYAEGDRLSVPVENAEKLSKYIGVTRPKLHRLSGSSWQQVTKKVKDETKLLARELLDLYARRETTKVAQFRFDAQAADALKQTFPFEETDDQAKAIAEVVADLQNERPMDRLVCGDVGFGKTEVAIRAAVQAVMNGKQVAILAPTTILTQQHADTFRERLKSLPAKLASLSRFESKEEQEEVLRGLKSGSTDIVIATHRLLSPDVSFKNLGLIIIDEEQRFGVRHKEQLKKLRASAHVITLSATPIPRTLNLALSGIRDISLIETPPEGRLPIETIIEPYDEALIERAIRFELDRNGQVYYLHNDVETIELAAENLAKLIPKASIGIAHGQLPERKLAEVMAAFDSEKIQVLVCSTIIENGLDLPNVNTLIVENATNFGLASLYQLRGRIGRGLRQAYAYFFYHRRLLTGEAKKRLQALLEARELGSGFQLALRDLEIRGVGNILGREQHGKIATVGFALYTRLLAQAVEELKTGKPAKTLRDILIDLPADIGIPRTYVASEPKRLRLYQELANITRAAELHRKKGELEEKYGKVPESTAHLLDLLELKLLCQDTQITSLKSVRMEGQERIVISFSPTIDPKRLPQLLARNPKWTFTQEAIKIERQFLSSRWLNDLKETVKIFRGDSPKAG